MQSEVCYMCGEPATTIEHVPPKCLFPESKESDADHRINLITVPSCEVHNGKKSDDDEFLMVSLAGIIGNNSIGYKHFNGKIQRAIKRSSFKLLDQVFLKKKKYTIKTDNAFLDILWGTPDYNRLVSCFKHIAFGIHRYHYKNNFLGEVKPYLGFLHNKEQNPKAFKKLITNMAKKELVDLPKHGENQNVFFYQFTKPDKFGYFLIKLCFYQNIDVYVSYMPSHAEKPFLLAMELMNSGIKTIIKENGEEFEFN